MPFIKKLVVMATLPLPNAVRWWLLPWISRHCLSSPFAAHMLENIGVKDTTAYYESLARQAALTDAFTSQVRACSEARPCRTAVGQTALLFWISIG